MPVRFSSAVTAFALVVSPAAAEEPGVVVDIAPVHSLVARVMQGIGEPALIVGEGASPHGYSLRPSQAAALQDAQVVFWTSASMTPWLGDAIAKLADDARTVELVEADGVIRLPVREGATFESHDHHGDERDGEDRHTEENPEHEDHGEEGHHEHGHGGVDPHAWLDPINASVWIGMIADALAEADPARAETYRSNAAAAQVEIAALTEELDAEVARVRGRPYIVFHDAYQYFGQRFDVPAAGAISVGDASAPSPSRVAEVRALASELGAVCVFAEPQFNPGLVEAVFEGEGVRTAVLDPLGVGLDPGPDLYPTLMRKLAQSLSGCLE